MGILSSPANFLETLLGGRTEVRGARVESKKHKKPKKESKNSVRKSMREKRRRQTRRKKFLRKKLLLCKSSVPIEELEENTNTPTGTMRCSLILHYRHGRRCSRLHNCMMLPRSVGHLSDSLIDRSNATSNLEV